jgi:hypothetical protein
MPFRLSGAQSLRGFLALGGADLAEVARWRQHAGAQA